MADQLAIYDIDDAMLENMMSFAKEVTGSEDQTLADFSKLCATLFGQPA
jgi:hypothetical protein